MVTGMRSPITLLTSAANSASATRMAVGRLGGANERMLHRFGQSTTENSGLLARDRYFVADDEIFGDFKPCHERRSIRLRTVCDVTRC